MQKYRLLKSVFHQYDHDTAASEAQRRRSNGFETRFTVGAETLFYTATPRLLQLQEKILRNERSIKNLAQNIPVAARKSYLYNLIIREIAATNEIEGVHSTRQEIMDALEAAPNEHKKFREIATLYLELSQGKVEPPVTLEGIRATYDSLFGSEIEEDDRLDGDLFRTGPVYVRDGANEVIHAGAKDEGEISEQLKAMLEHLEDDSASFLLSRVVSHFMFEAVHPFYDGNGRFGRFLLSAQLLHIFSAFTVLTLASQINGQRPKYYRAFTDVEEPLNFADATPFVHTMLELIQDAQVALMDDFELKQKQMSALESRLDVLVADDEELTEGLSGTLYVLAQERLFGNGLGVTWDTLTEVSGRSRSTTRKYIEGLETKGLAERISSRPLCIRLSQAGRSRLFED